MKSFYVKNISLCMCLVFLCGCSTFKFLSQPAKEAEMVTPEGLKDLRGALHVHTYYPQDKKAIEKLAAAADKIGLDFVVVSDHNSLSALQDKKEGLYGKTLVIIGDEVSTDSGHVLVWGIRKPLTARTPSDVAREVHAQGGLLFIAHPFAKDYCWKNWSFADYDGVEVYNTQANALDEDFLSLVVRGVVLFPDEFYRSMIKVSSESVKKWDGLIAQRKVVGIGSTDAHESHGLPGFEVDSYNVMLKSVNCHVFAEGLTREQILKAFRSGVLYFSFDIFANPRGFDFYLKRGDKKFLMGETVVAAPDDTLVVTVNREAHIRLIHDGKVISENIAEKLEVPVSGKGVYRAEVYLNRRPWIYANPIYVEEETPPAVDTKQSTLTNPR